MKISDYYRTYSLFNNQSHTTSASQQLFDYTCLLSYHYPESRRWSKSFKCNGIHIQKRQTQYCSQICLSAQAAYSKHDYTEAAELFRLMAKVVVLHKLSFTYSIKGMDKV